MSEIRMAVIAANVGGKAIDVLMAALSGMDEFCNGGGGDA